jgi:hypothetical protein
MSANVNRQRTRLRAWLTSTGVRAGLLALVVVCIVGLALLKATATDAGPLASLLKLILPFAFVGLALVDFRAAVAVAVFELVLAGAGGSWTSYGAHLSGRIFLDGVVMLRAVSIVIAAWRRGERSVLGRYGLHALVLAFLFPAIWMPIGLLHHNGAGNVFGDGNGFVFFAFAVVVITLVRGGFGAWFRNVFFAACATNGIINLLLIVASASHLITLKSVQDALIYRLDMGGIIGHMSDGAFRFFTGASLFLQIGLALSAWRLLARPRSYRYWLLFAVFWFDLGVTYTRGLWVGGAAAFALVLALGAPTLKRALTVSGVTAAGFAIAVLVASVAGHSFSSYVFKRADTITSSIAPSYPTAVVNPGFEKPGGWQPLDMGTPSLQASRSVSEHRSGSHSLELANTASSEDDYAYQYLSVRPLTRYRVTAWVMSAEVVAPPAGNRGLFVWEPEDNLNLNVPIGPPSSSWTRMAISFKTGRLALKIQIRLYAPKGRVYWDDVNLSVVKHGVEQPAPTTAPAPPNIQPGDTAGQSGDFSGEISNGYRVVEAKSLFRHIRKHPLLGSGFGAIATDFATGYRYELSYLDLLFKAGIVGLLLFLSFPLRLIWDALRLRFGRPEKSHERALEGGSLAVAIVASVLLVGATNPYLFAAFGLFAILATLAWLEPAPELVTEPRKN